MLIDGIFFSHGGASDIPGRKVTQSRGIIKAHGRHKRTSGVGNIKACNFARADAYKQLAEQAIAMGANAVLNVQINPFVMRYSDSTYWEAPISGDAVTLGDED